MPFVTEHAARQTDPKLYDSFRRGRPDGWPDGLDAIYGIPSEGGSEIQSIRADAEKWTVGDFKKWLEDNEFKSDIEAAKEPEADTKPAEAQKPEAAKTPEDGDNTEYGEKLEDTTKPKKPSKAWDVEAMRSLAESWRDEHGNLCLLRSVSLSEGLPTEVDLLYEGVNPTTKGDLIFDAESAKLTMKEFADKGQDLLPFDYDHGMLSKSPTPDSSKAAAWFLPVITDNGGLRASQVEFTPKATEALMNREYRFYSPAVKVVPVPGTPNTYRVVKLVNVALTNLPASKGQLPLVASDKPTVTSEEDMASENLLKLLRAENDEMAETVAAQLMSLNESLLSELGVSDTGKIVDAVKTLKESAASATKLAEQVRDLTLKLNSNEMEALIVELNDAGKLPESLYAWARTQTVENLKEFGKSAPANPKYAGGHKPADEESVVVLSDAEKKIAKKLGMSLEDYAKAKKEQAAEDAADAS